jgi:nucleoside-diphosphate-sugar epimerase
LKRIIITGASGFVGRHLLDDLKTDYRIFALARRSQFECQAPVHPNIAWIRADITDTDSLSRAFREIKTAGGADFFIHLAAYYDFAQKDEQLYIKTNIDGTRNILDFTQDLDLELFIFISSVAACPFPVKNAVVNELTPPDAEHIYARTKREGEEMIKTFAQDIPSCIVRFGAIYSDWCEYAPLYMFLNGWLGTNIKGKILAGRGQSAVPYVHIRDIIAFFRCLLDNYRRLQRCEILIASTVGATSHLELYRLATRFYYGKTKRTIRMPRFLCVIGLYAMSFWGMLTKKMPFERPWMGKYIDKQLTVDNTLTSTRLNWQPDSRYAIERRIRFLVERLKSQTHVWHIRNNAAMERVSERPELRIYTCLINSEDDLIRELLVAVYHSDHTHEFPKYKQTEVAECEWFLRLIYRLLVNSLYSSNRLLILNYFETLRFNRFEQGFTAEELVNLLQLLNRSLLNHCLAEPPLKSYDKEIYDCISVPIEFAIDEIEEQYKQYKKGVQQEVQEKAAPPKDARSQLEETIWHCLVQRK